MRLDLPSQPKLAATGVSGDQPQIIERMVWESAGQGVKVQVSYDRWNRTQFAPERSLELVARRQLGLTDGYEVQPAELGELKGAILIVGSAAAPQLMIFRAKSGPEGWQIQVQGSREAAEAVRKSVAISAKPEPNGLFDEWGNRIALSQNVSPLPSPTGPTFRRNTLEAAKVAFEAPFVLEERTLQRRESAEGISDISEWFGREQGTEIYVSYFRLEGDRSLDMPGWVAAYGQRMRTDGFLEFSPDIERISLEGAEGRVIFGQAKRAGQPVQIQIMLVIRGQDCWAIQSRTPVVAGRHPAHVRLRESLQLG